MVEKRRPGVQFRMPKYAIVVVALAVIAVVLILASSASIGLQSCSGKVVEQARYSCYTYYAHLYSNTSICGNLAGQYKDDCVYNVSMSLSNPSLCASISSQSYRAKCVSGISSSTRNATACSILAEPYASSCLYGVAKAEGFSSASLCASISNSTLSASCAASHYYDSAMTSRNAGYCAYLSHSPNSIELDAIMASEGASSSPAIYTFYNVTPFGYCYSTVAQELGDKSMCDSLNSTDAAICIAGFSSQVPLNITQARSSCDQLASTNSTLQYACNAGISIYSAVHDRNVSLCLSLNGSFHDTCVLDVATAYNDTSYCSYMSNASAAYACNVTVVGNYSG